MGLPLRNTNQLYVSMHPGSFCGGGRGWWVMVVVVGCTHDPYDWAQQAFVQAYVPPRPTQSTTATQGPRRLGSPTM